MKCPRCEFDEDRVVDSRVSREGQSVRRRRECVRCAHRFTTLEEIVPTEIVVVKRDERREDYDPKKIRDGIHRACWKRPVNAEKLEQIYLEVHSQVEHLSDREVPSEKIGRFVMEELKNVDDIAYVRFASVYRQFKDIDQFMDEIKQLKDATP